MDLKSKKRNSRSAVQNHILSWFEPKTRRLEDESGGRDLPHQPLGLGPGRHRAEERGAAEQRGQAVAGPGLSCETATSGSARLLGFTLPPTWKCKKALSRKDSSFYRGLCTSMLAGGRVAKLATWLETPVAGT